jgi:predicted nuclease of restriction endonuclease-like (RecB) superfamily
MRFKDLTQMIGDTHNLLINQTNKSVNLLLTLRNWLIGYRIQLYEQSGEDRAQYGEKLIENLSQTLLSQKVPGCSSRSLWTYRRFYHYYPQILQTVSAKLQPIFLEQDNQIEKILPISNEIITQVKNESYTDVPQLPVTILLMNLSFSHFVELIKTEDALQRSFYEIESVRGNWSARELKRQMGSSYYERSGLSKNKEKLSKLIHREAHTLAPRDLIHDFYIFEFLGLKQKEVVKENDLRDALLDKLQEFLLEMGKGFCFEARNKKILIGDEFFFVDLVLYNRIIKCHLLIELKINAFNHENIGQLNSYISYYKRNETTLGDNPPIGLLLCKEKNDTLVEYALADVNNQLFVSKYQLELPSKTEIKIFLENALQEIKHT